MPYLPGLDGMRALAVIAVMIFHANHDWLSAGFLGVEVFFVISGYLITLLLIAEHERSGEVSLGAFWGRRFRRLLPALYLTLVGIVVYCALFKSDELGKLRGDVVAAVFYVSNWFQIWTGQGYGAGEQFVPLRHLWSLAVEEQFYLIWPLVMIVLLRRGRERLPQVGMWLIAIAFLIAAATSLFFHVGQNFGNPGESPDAYFELFGRSIEKNNFLYLGTISRSSGILLGAGFAMLWRPLAMMRGPMRDKGRTMDIVAIVAIVGLAGQMLVYQLISEGSSAYYPPLFNGGLLLTGVLTILLIAAVTHSGSTVGRLLGNPVLNWVGTRSYGLYLFHWPIYQIIREQSGLSLSVAQFVLALVITGIVTEASYRFVESPVRAREFFSRFRSGTPQVLLGLGAVGLLVGYGGVSLARSDVQCTGAIECSTAGDPTDTTVATTPTSDTTPVSQATSVPGESTTTAAPTTVARAVIPVLAIGESVMAGATTSLRNEGMTVDAAESRGPNKVLELVQTYVANNDVQALVVQVGTNGTVSQEQYEAIATAAAAVPKVVFMTIKAPKDWVPGNNAIIRSLPATHPNVSVIDWETDAQQIESELSESDGGIHLDSGTAIRFYSNLILGAVGLPLIEDPAAATASTATG